MARRTASTKDKRSPRRSGARDRAPRTGAPPTPSGVPRSAPAPSKRYTPPIPRSKRRSPKWMLGVIGFFLVLGLALIVLNYMTVLPDSPTNWYLLGGLVSIAVAFVIGTQYH